LISLERAVLAEVRREFPSDELFGIERGDGLSAVLGQMEQTSFGEPLYPTVEDRTANLIYLTVKNHPLSDGNKRSATALAAYYLNRTARSLSSPQPPQPNRKIKSSALSELSSCAIMWLAEDEGQSYLPFDCHF